MKHLEKFDVAVLGDEAAGIWLLNTLRGIRKNSLCPQKILWIRSKSETPKFQIPEAAADRFRFGDGLDGPVNIEITSPQRTRSWNAAWVQSHFRTPAQGLPLRPTERHLIALRHTLRNQPEILSLASAIWRMVGRTRLQSPENLLWASLLSTSLRDWTPRPTALAPEITILPMGEKMGPVRHLKKHDKYIELGFSTPIAARYWVINTNWKETLDWFPNPAVREKCTALHTSPLSPDVDYELTLNLNQMTPSPRNLVLLEDEEIPHPFLEIWPTVLRSQAGSAQSTLIMRAYTRHPATLESILASLQTAYGAFSRNFPASDTRVSSISPTLNLESCATVDQRNEAEAQLEKSALEFYQLCQTDFRAPTTGIFQILPAFHCYLPYPIGPLVGMQKVLSSLLGKKVEKATFNPLLAGPQNPLLKPGMAAGVPVRSSSIRNERMGS